MERPKPTQKMIRAATGENYGFIMGLHHGLNELPALASVYPILDFNETVAFAASSWKSRESKSLTIYHDLYRTFSGVFNKGMPWLNANKDIPEKLKETHRNLNPFEGKDLKDRLNEIEDGTRNRLFTELSDQANTYVFDGLYQQEKAKHGGDNYKIIPMGFHRAYPPGIKKFPDKEVRMKKLREPFISEIVRIFERYPVEVKKTKQPSLFD